MRNPFIIFTNLIFLLIFCQCNNRTEQIKGEATTVIEETAEGQRDTFSYCVYNGIRQDFIDTSFLYSLTHSPQEKTFTYEELNSSRRTKSIYDSIGLRRITHLWDKAVQKERVIQYDSIGNIQKIETLKVKNDSLQLSSIEHYAYSGGTQKVHYYKFYYWVGTHRFEKEAKLSYEYDDQGRVKTSLVQNKWNGKFSVCDTVKYFYKGNSNWPFEVHRNHEDTRYYISKPTDHRFQIETEIPDRQKGGVMKKTELLTFDDQQRITEYYTHTRFDPKRFHQRHYKYVLSYPSDTEALFVPGLVFLTKRGYPTQRIESYIESIVNTGCSNEAEIRTNMDYHFLPESILYYKSSDGIHWEPFSREAMH